MKKLTRTIALLLAAILVFSMTAFAAPSSQTNNGGGDQSLIDKLFLEFVNATISGDPTATLNPLGPEWIERAKAYLVAHSMNGEVVTGFNIHVDGSFKNLTVSGYFIESGVSYFWLHYKGDDFETGYSDPNNWEMIPCDTNGNAVNFTSPEKCSPFVLVKGSAPASTAVVAPKTGEVIAISAILALIMMAGAVVCAKKARLQK